MFNLPLFSVLALSSVLRTSLAHGVISSPTPRTFGSATLDACGQGAYTSLSSDIYEPIEYAVAKIDAGYNAEECNLFLCKGYQLEDNASVTEVYIPGTVVNIQVTIEVAHTGYANVSVVDLASQTPIATLYTWDVYANNSLTAAQRPADETNFNVTIPDLGTSCQTAGACAIQWFWYGTAAKQTYESCIDFTQ